MDDLLYYQVRLLLLWEWSGGISGQPAFRTVQHPGQAGSDHQNLLNQITDITHKHFFPLLILIIALWTSLFFPHQDLQEKQTASNWSTLPFPTWLVSPFLQRGGHLWNSGEYLVYWYILHIRKTNSQSQESLRLNWTVFSPETWSLPIRTGLINLCPVGRSCSYEERQEFARFSMPDSCQRHLAKLAIYIMYL